MTGTVERLEGRLRVLATTGPSQVSVATLVHVDHAARLARAADGELAAAGLGVVERAELLVATAELRALAERASWPELRASASAIALRLGQRRPPARRARRRVWAVVAAFMSAACPWRLPPGGTRPRE